MKITVNERIRSMVEQGHLGQMCILGKFAVYTDVFDIFARVFSKKTEFGLIKCEIFIKIGY